MMARSTGIAVDTNLAFRLNEKRWIVVTNDWGHACGLKQEVKWTVEKHQSIVYILRGLLPPDGGMSTSECRPKPASSTYLKLCLKILFDLGGLSVFSIKPKTKCD